MFDISVIINPAIILNNIDRIRLATKTELKYFMALIFSFLYRQIVINRPAIDPTAVVIIEVYPIILFAKGKKLYASFPTVLIRYGVKKNDMNRFMANEPTLKNMFLAICLLTAMMTN